MFNTIVVEKVGCVLYSFADIPDLLIRLLIRFPPLFGKIWNPAIRPVKEGDDCLAVIKIML